MSLSRIRLWSGFISQSQHYWNALPSNTYLQYYPSPICLSPFLYLRSVSPPVLWSPSPSPPLYPSLFPHAHTLSPPLSPLFLSIHTTESLLIICDLLKYIHCHSLSLPLSFLSPSLSLLPGLLFSNLLALLIPSLWVLSVSFVFLFCRIICATSPPPVPQRSHKHTLWDTASWCILCERVCWWRRMKPLHVAAETAHTHLKTVQTIGALENCTVLNLKHPLEPRCVKHLVYKFFCI